MRVLPMKSLRCTCRGAFGHNQKPVFTLSRHSNGRRSGACHATKGADGRDEGHLLGMRIRDFGESLIKHKQQAASAAAGLILATCLASGGPAIAADAAKVGSCLVGNCQGALARCLADGECLENLVCLQLCNGRPDEAACQIRCGDLYQDSAIEAFTACAVSDKKCVPQKVDKDAFPVPSDCALDQSFDLNNFQGRWYITAGLNPLFDQFDCQEHFFGVPEPGKLYAKINWRIPKGDNDFIERKTVQTFKQVEGEPAKLENHGNAFLHYSDDWYILGFRPDEYVLIYYIGNNDAWKGYGGATVYTRAEKLPDEYIPEIEAKLKPLGIKWSDFKVTDNTCGPHPVPINPLERIEKFAEDEVRAVEYEIEKDLTSFGKGFTVLEQDLEKELTEEEKIVEADLRDAERFLEGIEKQYEEKLFEGPLNFLRKLKLPFFGSKGASTARVAASEVAQQASAVPDAPSPGSN